MKRPSACQILVIDRTVNRRIVHKKELLQDLKMLRCGIKSAYMELMTLDEQALLASESSTIVAVHGAAIFALARILPPSYGFVLLSASGEANTYEQHHRGLASTHPAAVLRNENASCAKCHPKYGGDVFVSSSRVLHAVNSVACFLASRNCAFDLGGEKKKNNTVQIGWRYVGA